MGLVNSQHLSLPGPPSGSCNMVVPIFQDTLWLGGKHDGYKRVPFPEKYLELRPPRRGPKDRPESVSHRSRELLAQMQCLLNFGLLEAVMEKKIPESKLIRVNSSGEQVLTSKHLPNLLLGFEKGIRKRQGDDSANISEACREWARSIKDAFNQAQGILYGELREWKNNESGSVFLSTGLEPQVLADIVIQIGSILNAVGFSTRAFYPEVQPIMGNGIAKLLDKVPYQLRTSMFGRGWCPVIGDTISREFSTCMLGYARTLECPRSRSAEGHAECTPESCVVNTRDSSNDPPKHFPESCKCSNSMPSLEDVKRLLQERKIPVVGDGLSVKDSSDTPFVAISHVWGDGLRGTTEKGLPRCQIERLAQMTSCILEHHGRASWGGAFWIDTLCIPEIDDMRHRAIGLMAQTYREAEAVLVIDSGLRDVSSRAPLEEKMFHVVFSRWMQRLWTFQEAALAKKVYFEFSDALVSLDDLRKKKFSIPKDLDDLVVGELLSGLFRAHRGLLGFSTFKFMDIYSILRKRTASKQSDETLAVSAVLNLDGFELASISDPDQRMETFLLRVGKLPADIIFLTGVSRLEKPGFRWAPRSFMRSEVLASEREALCTSTGLEAEYDALTQGVVVGGENSEWYISHSYEGRMVIYQVVPIKPESVSTPFCNTLLLDFDILVSGELNATRCAGVWVDPESAHGVDRILCEFRTALFLDVITGIELSELEKSHTVMSVEYVRRMRVKVV